LQLRNIIGLTLSVFVIIVLLLSMMPNNVQAYSIASFPVSRPIISNDGRFFTIQDPDDSSITIIYNLTDQTKVKRIDGRVWRNSFFQEDSRTIIDWRSNVVHWEEGRSRDLFDFQYQGKIYGCTQYNSSNLLIYTVDYINYTLNGHCYLFDIFSGDHHKTEYDFGDISNIGVLDNSDIVYWKESWLHQFNNSLNKSTKIIEASDMHCFNDLIYYSHAETYQGNWLVERYNISSKSSEFVHKMKLSTHASFSISADGQYIGYLTYDDDYSYSIIYDTFLDHEVFTQSYKKPKVPFYTGLFLQPELLCSVILIAIVMFLFFAYLINVSFKKRPKK